MCVFLSHQARSGSLQRTSNHTEEPAPNQTRETKQKTRTTLRGRGDAGRKIYGEKKLLRRKEKTPRPAEDFCLFVTFPLVSPFQVAPITLNPDAILGRDEMGGGECLVRRVARYLP